MLDGSSQRREHALPCLVPLYPFLVSYYVSYLQLYRLVPALVPISMTFCVLLVLIITLSIERTVIRNIAHTIILTLQSVFYDWLVPCSVFFLDAFSYAKLTLAYRVTI